MHIIKSYFIIFILSLLTLNLFAQTSLISKGSSWKYYGKGTNANPLSATVGISRGPYLQSGTSNSMIIRWQTDVATDSKVNYGLTQGNLNQSISDANSFTEHEIKLSGLTAGTKYYYSIGTTSQTLQGDISNYFITSPVTGTNKKTNIWVTGDCGNNSTNQKNVRDQYISYMGTKPTDAWILLGDNAYNNGTDLEYQNNFFNIYGSNLLKNAVLWPAPGNHDYANTPARQNDHFIPYYDIFTVPVNGEAGGIASKTESFYSFNYGNIHFLSLDSYGNESNTYRLYDTLGPQATWVKNDLANNTMKWTIAYWHHPPYTMGSHNSDTEGELIAMRQNFIRILERYKVDLILCGHSHSYERSKLMKGHYGNEASFNAATQNLSSSSGKYDGSQNSCPYVQSSAASGTVYIVSGSAGQVGGTQASYPHDAMYYSNAVNGGSMAIEIDENRMDAKWICADGVIRDNFTIFKDINKITNINVANSQSTTLTATWNGTYSWSPGGATTKSITINPISNETYTVSDNNNCISDKFNISTTITSVIDSSLKGLRMKTYPNPLEEDAFIEYTLPDEGNLKLEIYNTSGKLVNILVDKKEIAGDHRIAFSNKDLRLNSGIYFIKLKFNDLHITEKVSILK